MRSMGACLPVGRKVIFLELTESRQNILVSRSERDKPSPLTGNNPIVIKAARILGKAPDLIPRRFSAPRRKFSITIVCACHTQPLID